MIATADDYPTMTTAEVAEMEGITVRELLFWHLDGKDPGDLAWNYVEEIRLDNPDNLGEAMDEFELDGYLCGDEDEEGYMEALERAMNEGDVPPPAYIFCAGRYHKGDGGHRTAIAWDKWGYTHAWVACCTVHDRSEGDKG